MNISQFHIIVWTSSFQICFLESVICHFYNVQVLLAVFAILHWRKNDCNLIIFSDKCISILYMSEKKRKTSSLYVLGVLFALFCCSCIKLIFKTIVILQVQVMHFIVLLLILSHDVFTGRYILYNIVPK